MAVSCKTGSGSPGVSPARYPQAGRKAVLLPARDPAAGHSPGTYSQGSSLGMVIFFFMVKIPHKIKDGLFHLGLHEASEKQLSRKLSVLFGLMTLG